MLNHTYLTQNYFNTVLFQCIFYYFNHNILNILLYNITYIMQDLAIDNNIFNYIFHLLK
jgi:uncharacterized lipoprotein YajG